MGAGLATPQNKTQDSSRESSAAAPQSATFAPSSHGAWGDGPSAAGAPAGMPLFLQPQVQMKCAECATREQEAEDRVQPPVQKKCAHCEAEEQNQRAQGVTSVQAKCPACEAEGLREHSA